MASKSKSLILIFIITIIIFIAVSLFKHFNVDNSEPVFVKPISENSIKTKIKERTKHEEPNFDVIDALPHPSEITEQDRKNHAEKVGSALNKSLMYDTPEKILKAVIYYQDNNQDEKAAEYIDYLIQRFPDYKFNEEDIVD